ncbi:MAG: DUF3256 family protein [Prevotella sp.]|nr:DUF3256 family protein [Candidatus Equicola stercoris]
MKFRWILFSLFFIFAQDMSAQTMKMLFAEMPDSLLPYIIKNRRLDCIDFVENNMKAEIENSFGGKSELLSLTDSTAEMKLSETSLLKLQLVSIPEKIIIFEKIISVPEKQSFARYYNTDWKEVFLTEKQLLDVKKCLTANEKFNLY